MSANHVSEEEMQAVELLEHEIRAYRENDNLRHSPIWIWFTKYGPEEAKCLLCGQICPKIASSTSNMMMHIKRHHGPRQNYNAWVVCEELMELKELRMINKKSIDKRKHEEKMASVKKLRELTTVKRKRKQSEGGEGGGGGSAGKRPVMDEVDGTMELEYEMAADSEDRVPFGGEVSDDDIAEAKEMPFDSSGGELNVKTEVNRAETDDIFDRPTSFSAPRLLAQLPSSSSSSSSPIHVNVGGEIFNASLKTLRKFPESRLGKMFRGGIAELHGIDKPFFIDRDGKLFRYILNFCRTSRLVLPESFDEMELLHEEAVYFDIPSLIAVTKSRMRSSGRAVATSTSASSSSSSSETPSTTLSADAELNHDCVYVHVTNDSVFCERVDVTASKSALEEVFPESTEALRSGGVGIGGGWEFRRGYVVKFPVDECCQIYSLEALRRLMDKGYAVATSSTGERDGKSFTEYLMMKKNLDVKISSTYDANESC